MSMLVYAEETALTTMHTQAAPITAVSPADIPGHHERIKLSEHKYSSVLLEDILDQQSGIQVRQLGGKGQFSYPSIRGASGQQIQVIWDGIPLSSLNNSEADVPSIGFSVLSSLDIYRGIAPVELAPTAIGGTLHLVSKDKFDSPSSGQLSLSAGRFQSYGAGIWHQWQNKHWQLFTALDWFSSQNDFVHLQKINAFNNPNEAQNEKRLNNAAKHRLGIIRLNYRGFDHWSPGILIQQQEKKRQIPGLRNVPDNHAFFKTKDERISIKLGHHNDSHSSQVIASAYQQNEIYDDQDDLIGLGRDRNIYSTDGYLLKFNHTQRYQTLTTLVTAAVQQEEAEQKDDLLSGQQIKDNCLNTKNCPSNYDRQQTNVGTRLHWFPYTDTSIHTQLNYIRLNDQEKTPFFHDKKNNNTIHWVGDTGISHDLFHWLTLEATYSQQVRPVATRELFGDRGLTLGNPELIAETSKGYSLGAIFKQASYQLTLSSYLRYRDNAITATADSRGVIRYENLAQTRHRGIELVSRFNMTNSLLFHGNSGFHQQTINQHSRPSFIGKRVPNQRTWDHNYTLSYQPSAWIYKINYGFQGGGFYDTTNILPMPVRERLNISVSIKLNSSDKARDTRLTCLIQNATDNRTSDFYNYPTAGRYYSLKLNHQW